MKKILSVYKIKPTSATPEINSGKTKNRKQIDCLRNAFEE